VGAFIKRLTSFNGAGGLFVMSPLVIVFNCGKKKLSFVPPWIFKLIVARLDDL
jgi:hypothetical protein